MQWGRNNEHLGKGALYNKHLFDDTHMLKQTSNLLTMSLTALHTRGTYLELTRGWKWVVLRATVYCTEKQTEPAHYHPFYCIPDGDPFNSPINISHRIPTVEWTPLLKY